MFRSIDMRFLLRLVRLDGELLQHRRPRPADQDAGQDQQHDRDRRQLQVAHERADEERHRAEARDEHQDQLGRQHRVQVGVGGAVEQGVAGGEQQLVALEEVVDREDDDEHARGDRQLHARRHREVVALGAEPDAAEDVVGDQRADAGDRDRDEQPGDQPADERQRERVEADVLAELGVGLAERHRVQHQLHRLPVGLAGRARDGADDERDADAEQAHPLHDRRPVPARAGRPRRRPARTPAASGRRWSG